MNLLLDTHIFIWLIQEPSSIPVEIRARCADPRNALFLSFASIWEMQIKRQQGKLSLAQPLRELVEAFQSTNALQLLPITAEHIFAVDKLPFHHKDPFDRMLIAQSHYENIKLVTVDAIFQRYGINSGFAE